MTVSRDDKRADCFPGCGRHDRGHVRSHLRGLPGTEQLGICLGTLTVRVEGDLDIRGFFGFGDGVRPGLSAVRVQVGITGPETPERYQELAAAVDEHCPVLDLFRNPVPVDRTLAVG